MLYTTLPRYIYSPRIFKSNIVKKSVNKHLLNYIILHEHHCNIFT